ncbi:SorB family sulfite dehydrogenase c-type cytochrome subunit [Microvirga sp. 2TAF3]|uniref:SorB family sulfite dehydrogenase c-type cytochrome subunit n=1 Tax=Microvirga sp. 2TAF3 TaxID=3233014 RepID=UPI003F96CA4D
MWRFCLTAFAIVTAATLAHADETAIKLKDAPGHDAVMNNCAACHSLDYIQMNSPFPDRKVWEAEVTKMIKAFGAPIDDEDAKAIVDYLAKNYGSGGPT